MPEPDPGADSQKGIDDLIGTVQKAVPDGPFKTFLKQAGWGGLLLAVLMGNIPVSAAIAKVASQSGSLNAGTISVYFDVFVLVTPWVAVFGVLAYCVFSGNYPQMNGAAYFFAAAILVGAAGWVSMKLGGPVPHEVTDGPTRDGPGGAGEYAATSLSAYIDLYGILPPLAGFVEGGLFGYWAAALEKN